MSLSSIISLSLYYIYIYIQSIPKGLSYPNIQICLARDHIYLSCDLSWFICKSSTWSIQFNGVEIQIKEKCLNHFLTINLRWQVVWIHFRTEQKIIYWQQHGTGVWHLVIDMLFSSFWYWVLGQQTWNSFQVYKCL